MQVCNEEFDVEPAKENLTCSRPSPETEQSGNETRQENHILVNHYPKAEQSYISLWAEKNMSTQK